jgi:carbonic anhydrase
MPFARGSSFTDLMNWHRQAHAPLASPPRARAAAPQGHGLTTSRHTATPQPAAAVDGGAHHAVAIGATHHSRMASAASASSAAAAGAAAPGHGAHRDTSLIGATHHSRMASAAASASSSLSTAAGAAAPGHGAHRDTSLRQQAPGGKAAAAAHPPAGGGWSALRAGNLALAAVMVCGSVVGLSMWYGGCRGAREVVVVPPDWARFAGDADEPAASWTYGAAAGPSQWGALVNASTGRLLFPECNGASQSPIDIDDASVVVAEGQAEVDQLYTVSAYTLLPRHGHHSFQLVPSASDGGAAAWTVDGVTYTLTQLHAHAPSEHRLNGRRYPLELHLIHANSAGELAGLAILYDLAPDEAPNAHLHAFWDQITAVDTAPVVGAFNFSGLVHDLLLSPHRLYRYSGSLTVPPCTQDLVWHVGVSRTGINSAQLVTFKFSMRMGDNARGQQPVNNRVVLAYD